MHTGGLPGKISMREYAENFKKSIGRWRIKNLEELAKGVLMKRVKIGCAFRVNANGKGLEG